MAAPSPNISLLRFGIFELDTKTGELRKSGRQIRLRPQAVRVLSVLAARAGELVTREQLKEEIWGQETFVDFEHGINLCIREVRAALNDDAETPRYIETLPRRGYRFIMPAEGTAETTSSQSPSAHAAGSKLRLRSIAISLAAIALLGFAVLAWRHTVRPPAVSSGSVRIESVAVLPLENLSKDPEQEYFADGITDALITDLAKIHALRVISRNSVMRYKSTLKSLPEIARDLNVDAVVEGTVQRFGDRVRIRVQLIEGPKDRHLWAESYERPIGDILAIQDDIAKEISEKLRLQLTADEQKRLAKHFTESTEAHQLYLKGRFYWNQRTGESAKKSIEFFQKAIEKDPNYALAYSGLADAIAPVYAAIPSKEGYPKAKAAAMKAIALDDTLAEAHTSLGFIYGRYDWDWPGAERELRRALELNPNYATAHQWYSLHYLVPMGRLEEAISEMQRAVELDPVSPVLYVGVGRTYYFARQYDRSIEQCRRALEFDPNFPEAHRALMDAYVEKRMFKEAIEAFTKGGYIEGGSAEGTAKLRRAYAKGGVHGYWKRRLELAEKRAKPSNVLPSTMAVLYARVGENDKAFEWLERALAERDAWVRFLKVYPDYDSLRSDSRFREVVRRVGLPP